MQFRNWHGGLAGAVTGATVVVALVLTGVPAANAGADGDLVLGSYISNGQCTPGTTNCTNFVTGVTSHAGGLTFRADGGTGLSGVSLSGAPGVSGRSSATGGIGVTGDGAAYGVEGQGGSFGLYGHDSSVGVYAQGTSEGVHGFSGSGIGVAALSSSGTALSVSGKATFSRSGKTLIQAGSASKTVSLTNLSSVSQVMATVQGRGIAGVFIQGVAHNTSSFTIYLNKAVPASQTLGVGWFVVN
jgi:hypothetical protein